MVRLGTRGSRLARWQATWTAQRLKQAGCDVETVVITTDGDQDAVAPADRHLPGRFTTKIQQALRSQQIDVAVHSLKDLPSSSPAGLTIAAVPARETPEDVLVAAPGIDLQTLPPATQIGTGSPRRTSQILHARPDLRIADIRGNVDTRLRKLDDGQYGALVLAAAGMIRLERQDRITEILDPNVFIPAAAQGALALEIRSDDVPVANLLQTLEHRPTRQAVDAERGLLRHLQAGCTAPVGALARIGRDNQMELRAVVLSADGQERIAAVASGPATHPLDLARRVGDHLLADGADRLLPPPGEP